MGLSQQRRRKMIKAMLIIFEIYSVLTPLFSDQVHPYVIDYFKEADDRILYAIATNQGGVGLRHWMERQRFGTPTDYPVIDDVNALITSVTSQTREFDAVRISYAYLSKKNQWSPTPSIPPLGSSRENWRRDWRKPEPGMILSILDQLNILPIETLVVGALEGDRMAAERAGCYFLTAEKFFSKEMERCAS